MSLSESFYLEPARRSISSSSSATHSECTIEVEEDNPLSSKPLPPIIDEFNLIVHPAPQSPTPPLTTISQLAYALGPDNIPHTTEIDTIPCAGVHIPHGALTGLLAWRLVVRLISSTKEKRRWNSYDNTNRANNYYTPPVHKSLQTHTGALVPFNPSASMSALSLPLFPQSAAGSRNDFTPKLRPYSVILPKQTQSSKPNLQTMVYQSQPQLDQNSPSFPSALTVNFILDTSLPYSIISRDTLVALGYPPYLIPPPSVSHLESAPPAMVVLSIQNIPTRFRIARPNEASRLGVQFLHDAGVSVFFPKDGAGVGPVLYVESAHLLKDVPRTIQRIGVKLTLPQRVRALLGLS